MNTPKRDDYATLALYYKAMIKYSKAQLEQCNSQFGQYEWEQDINDYTRWLKELKKNS